MVLVMAAFALLYITRRSGIISFTPARAFFLGLVLAGLSPGDLVAQSQVEADTAAAHRAALAWLALVDSGAYAASLDSAAPLLRQMIASTDQWEQFLGMARAPFPNRIQRELLEAEIDPSLPVTHPGRYIRLTFRIRGLKEQTTESVVLQAQSNGWRVAMYGVRGGS